MHTRRHVRAAPVQRVPPDGRPCLFWIGGARRLLRNTLKRPQRPPRPSETPNALHALRDPPFPVGTDVEVPPSVLLLAALVALLVGLALGLLGGGGSVLLLPSLVFLLDVEPSRAVPLSLLVVAATALTGLVAHARAGRVDWKTGGAFGAAGIVGAFLGGRVSSHLPPAVLLSGFGAIMIGTAFAMIRGRGASGPARPRSLAVLAALGAATGLVSGIFGAGGGFLVVPALAVIAGLPMQRAVGTSLLVIAMQASAGFAGHVATTSPPWGLAAVAIAAATVGGLVGARLASRFSQDALRRAFGWMALVVGTGLLVRGVPATAQVSLRLVVVVVVAALAVPALLVLARRRRA